MDVSIQAVILLGFVTLTNSVIVLLKCYIRRKNASTIEDCSSLTIASDVEKADKPTAEGKRIRMLLSARILLELVSKQTHDVRKVELMLVEGSSEVYSNFVTP